MEDHHSLADWDYAVPGPYITDEIFISPPSCLAAKLALPLNRQGWAMCNLASAQNVFDGRIVSNVHIPFVITVPWVIHCFYRAQANPTTPTGTPENCYLYRFRGVQIVLSKSVAGLFSDIAAAFLPLPYDQDRWYKFRATWWQYLQPDLTKLLRHTLEWDNNGTWEQLLQVDDSVNSWEASAVNKLGFLLFYTTGSKITAIDNTEIWKRLA